ncbi:hypothetical protein [Nocardia asteroides]|uniref:Uncharacterized protein n=1 Tax=Nocardia asteroides NBRC 15531 TaxID=1110697 RepID=U5E655_NOCAS|nr:hypothetical protein [Nocardia asteroides]UGT48816.1 hypothetical protein LT345_31025 [Nocardia asteroides]GAD85347.1 hypothetical protein NCAST_31_00410 [Nocardia asteroides NBRC 15531]SFL71652.1 hypothetical protein SAMN05444423_101648 [Nocardia asteroides]VEG31425.1 Uncharacterised protein [Nocardia asteroides]
MSQPLPSQQPTVIDPADAAAYLRQMDIDVAHIVEAIQTGEIQAANLTEHHPPTGAGLTRWIHVVGRLRYLLADTNRWEGRNHRNRPFSVWPDHSYTLSTVGGNEATGIADHPTGPMAANRKGKATAEAVHSTLPLITVEALRAGAIEHVEDWRSRPPQGAWFLLYYRDSESIRLEVSLPLGFDDGQFTGWKVRVILDEWRPEDVTARPNDIGGGDVDFEVVEAS